MFFWNPPNSCLLCCIDNTSYLLPHVRICSYGVLRRRSRFVLFFRKIHLANLLQDVFWNQRVQNSFFYFFMHYLWLWPCFPWKFMIILIVCKMCVQIILYILQTSTCITIFFPPWVNPPSVASYQSLKPDQGKPVLLGISTRFIENGH